jgi:hypothetical protein
LRVGLNWSAPLGNPLQNDAFRLDGDHVVRGLAALAFAADALRADVIYPPWGPKTVAAH